MPAFEYIALNQQGRQVKGVLEADTPRQVRQMLREKSLTPLDVTPVIEKSRRHSSKMRLGRGVKVSELATVTRQLATLVASAIPLEEALKAVAEQTEYDRMRSILMAIRARVLEGHALADALKDFPHIFDRLFRSMVAAGEKSGHLDGVLERLADYQERQAAIRTRIKMAMLYPVILLFIAFAVVTGLLIYVMPKIVDQFTSMGGELPALTRIMMRLSDILVHHGWWLALLLIAAVTSVRRFVRARRARQKRWHSWLLRLPIIGRVSRGLNSARLARTLAITTSSGVPLLDGLNISADVMSNLVLRDAVQAAAVRVREGTSLHRALAETGQFPPIMLHMIASGERSGEIETMLARAAEAQEREFENIISVALGLMEPLVIVFMGVVVLMIVMAILLPIFMMNTLVAQ